MASRPLAEEMPGNDTAERPRSRLLILGISILKARWAFHSIWKSRPVAQTAS